MMRPTQGATVTLAFLLLAGCRGPDGVAVGSDVPPADGAVEGKDVALIVFIGQDQACACTRDRIDKSWKALQDALAGRPGVKVHKIQWDVDEMEAEKYSALKPVMVIPGIYFLDDKGGLVAFLQGEVTAAQIAAVMAGGSPSSSAAK
jgi:hypothetical protein